MNDLMASTTHRANILTRRYDSIGIGAAVNGRETYFSVIFALR
jgi:uncharacterized protein YkwD